MTHIQTIVESIGHVLEEVVKVNLYVTNVSDMPIVDEVYATFFKTVTSARRVVGVKHLPQGALIQIDVVVGNVITASKMYHLCNNFYQARQRNVPVSAK